ncbi:MAG: iron complex transport system ATP-binding protein [Cyclobacteriaceae bacterium]|jgi:iron complex transport system ATP-binding protein
MMSKPETVLETKDLVIGYGKKVIAQNLNLTANTNEIICLLGQNGVGKSTLLRTISNLQSSLYGDIIIEKNDIRLFDPQELAQVLGIVTTEKIGAANMTVRELVTLGRYPYTNWLGKISNADQEKIDDSIAQCRIDYLVDKKIGDLSDGQRQKAMIARVLAQDTKIILLDEPTAHLDLINRAEIMRLLSDIKGKKSIIISTHELPLSMQFADKLWLMNFNQPFISGTPEDLAVAGKINQSFHENEFEIDVLTGKVNFQRNIKGTINLKGEGSALLWTSQALQRVGYQINKDSEKKIEVTLVKSSIQWSLISNNYTESGQSIELLLKQL